MSNRKKLKRSDTNQDIKTMDEEKTPETETETEEETEEDEE